MDERRHYREKFEGYAATAQRDFDRIIATLAGGALGLSVTFIHDLSPAPEHLGRLVIETQLWLPSSGETPCQEGTGMCRCQRSTQQLETSLTSTGIEL